MKEWYNKNVEIMYKEILKQIGLTDKEAAVYETLLELGLTPASPIIKKTGLKRGIVYYILSLLIKKGLVEQLEKQGKAHFQVTSPENLRKIISEKEESFEQNKKGLANILPSLKAQYNLVSDKPIIQYFEGIEGVKEIFSDILKEKKDLFIFASTLGIENPEFDRLVKRQIKKQAKGGIKVKALGSHDDPVIGYEYLKECEKYSTENRVIKNFRLDAQIIIYGDKIALTSFKKDFVSTLIENKAITRSVKRIFDTLWDEATPLYSRDFKK